eukprot:TRINITY_DN7025_c0_g1_i9.p1 TRINITY_DN7025_c0_g1~~TRINITY_DN7025_c0_g1_i9.p1  ORF type:complete len:469 (-),score=45.22 TRINITY_DN7025_c0_g1_i9:141-1547(-)
MQLMRYLLVLCAVGWISCQYNSIGLRKTMEGVKSDFKRKFMQIFSTIRYIEFYDISKPLINIPIPNPTVTLSEIRLSSLTLNDKANLDFKVNTHPHFVDIVRKKELNLGWTATLNAKWNFGFGPFVFQEGSLKTSITGDGTTFRFRFNENYKESNASISSKWKCSPINLKESEPFGFILGYVNDALNDILSSIDKEMNKYGVLVLNLMTYGKSLKRVAIRGKLSEADSYIVSEIGNLVRPTEKFPLNAKFNSFLLDMETHEKAAIDYPFSPGEHDAHDVAFYLGYRAAQAIASKFLTVSFANFTIGAKLQQELFGRRLTVRSLIPFCPRLAGEYDPTKELDLQCALLTADFGTAKFTCAFNLTSTKTTILLIDELRWNKHITLGYDVNTKEVTIENGAKGFSSLVAKNAYMRSHAARQLMLFLMPVSSYLAEASALRLKPVLDKDELDYVAQDFRVNEWLAVYYKVTG